MIEGFFSIDTDSADDDIDGKEWEMRALVSMSIQVDHGAITGTLKVQSRNHVRMPWSDAADMDLANPDGSAASEIVDVAAAPARYYRVHYDSTSGDEHLRVCVHAKGR